MNLKKMLLKLETGFI